MDNVNVVSAVANVKVAEAATEMLPQRTGKSCKPSSRFKSLLKGGVAAAVLLSATAGVVSEASASTVNDWLNNMPVNGGSQYDTNRDGRVDHITYDTNRDRRLDAERHDTNNDGYLETVLLDANLNGLWDQVISDTNGDGTLDTARVDNNEDGAFDMVGFDLNRTGYYSGWTSLSHHAQQGNTTRLEPNGGGGYNIVVGGNTDGLDAYAAARDALNQLPGYATGGSVYDPTHPRDYGTYRDSYRHSRRRPDGTLYSTGRR
jgi:hypothetical protein